MSPSGIGPTTEAASLWPPRGSNTRHRQSACCKVAVWRAKATESSFAVTQMGKDCKSKVVYVNGAFVVFSPHSLVELPYGESG